MKRIARFSPSPRRGEGRGEEANDLEMKNPLTPTLSPFGRGEGAGRAVIVVQILVIGDEVTRF